MAQNRFYSSNAITTTIPSGCSAVATSITAASTSGFPTSFPYTLLLDWGSSTVQEAVLVTNAVGTTLTVTRGIDGTTAAVHAAGALAVHGVTEQDFAESAIHINATGPTTNPVTGSAVGVHGLQAGSAVVGTTDTQTLTGKSMTSPAVTGTVTGGASYTAPTVTNPTVTGTVAGGASYTSPTITGAVAGGASYTAPTITSPTVTGTVAGGASYTAPTVTSPTVTGTVAGSATYNTPTITSPTFTGGLVELNPTATKTANYTAVAGDLVICDLSSGGFTVTLPTAPPNHTQAAFKIVKQAATTPNVLTVACGGSDVFDVSGGAATGTVSILNQSAIFQYNSGVWIAKSSDTPFSQLQNAFTSVINVRRYGAKGDGTTDDTAAIQAAINAATGSASPSSTTRIATAPVYLPAGSYKVTSDLVIRSVEGFQLVGDGAGAVTIYASGTGFTQAVLAINGSLDGVFKGFCISGLGTEKSGTNDLYNGLRLDWVQASRADPNCGTTNTSAVVTNTDAQVWDVGATVTGTGIPVSTTVLSVVPGTSWTLSNNCTATGSVTVTVASLNAAARSTTGNRFEDIRIRALKADTLFSLEGNGSAQVDGTVMENVVVSGAQTVGSWVSTGLYTKGFAFGNGTFANNYDHVQAGCGASGCYYGWYNNASSFALYGAQPAGNFCDFYLNAGSQTTISNVQSQSCGTFITTPSMFAPIPVTVSDVFIKTANAAIAGQVMLTLNGGLWDFRNFVMTNITSSGSFVPGAIAVTGSTSVRPCLATFENLVNNASKTATFTTLTNAQLLVRSFINYNPTTGNYTAPVTGDMTSFYFGGAWTQLDQAAVTWLTTAGTTTYTSPTGATTFETALQAGGGGGGSGCLAASGQAGGGAAGNAGGYSKQVFTAADFGASQSVTVGDGGTGGTAVTTPGNGNAGSTGGQSTCGSLLHANGGGGGAGGTAAAGGAASTAVGTGWSQWGSLGGAGSATTTGSAGAAPTAFQSGASGGGGGAGTTGAAAANGGATQIPIIGATGNTAAGGVAGGANPGTGTQPAVKGVPSCGGGGGASAFGTNAVAQNGAQPFYGGGGGGGGGCSGGGTASSGAGAKGGVGFILIIARFT